MDNLENINEVFDPQLDQELIKADNHIDVSFVFRLNIKDWIKPVFVLKKYPADFYDTFFIRMKILFFEITVTRFYDYIPK